MAIISNLMLQIVLSPNESSNNGCESALTMGISLKVLTISSASTGTQNITEVHLSGKTEHSECSELTGVYEAQTSDCDSIIQCAS